MFMLSPWLQREAMGYKETIPRGVDAGGALKGIVSRDE